MTSEVCAVSAIGVVLGTGCLRALTTSGDYVGAAVPDAVSVDPIRVNDDFCTATACGDARDFYMSCYVAVLVSGVPG